MGCNCKRLSKFQDKYGQKEKESILTKGYRYTMKLMMFPIVLCIGIIVVPFVLIYLICKLFFGNKNKPFVLPDFSKFYK